MLGWSSGQDWRGAFGSHGCVCNSTRLLSQGARRVSPRGRGLSSSRSSLVSFPFLSPQAYWFETTPAFQITVWGSDTQQCSGWRWAATYSVELGVLSCPHVLVAIDCKNYPCSFSRGPSILKN